MLLLWTGEKRFVDLWYFVIVLALTGILLISLNKNVVLLIFGKISINCVIGLSEAAKSAFEWTLSHRGRIVEADSWNSLFRCERFA